jgi:hypothetical protein
MASPGRGESGAGLRAVEWHVKQDQRRRELSTASFHRCGEEKGMGCPYSMCHAEGNMRGDPAVRALEREGGWRPVAEAGG